MTKRLHDTPFDEGTLTKLKIFNNYLVKWIPVFVAKKDPIWTNINICDFFCGPGTDCQGNYGSPLLIIKALEPYHDQIIQKRLNIKIILNDSNPKNIEELNNRLKQYTNIPYEIKSTCKEFSQLLEEKYPLLSDHNSVNMLFMDQGGIKEISEDIFLKIVKLEHTDSLFYITSGTFRRFGGQNHITKHIQLDLDLIKKVDYKHIHRSVLSHYKQLIPSDMKYYLVPFSIKKKGNIYGLIFGAKHLLALDFFLHVAWEIDPMTGDSNYDIDNEKINEQLSLFPQDNVPNKIKVFENELENDILSGRIATNMDLYIHTLEQGFLPIHTKNVLRKLKTEKKIRTIKFVLSSILLKDSLKIMRLELI